MFCQSFVKALLNRGHEVTYLTSQSLSQNRTNYNEVLIVPPFDLHSLSEFEYHIISFGIINFKLFAMNAVSQETLMKMGSASPFMMITQSIKRLGVINNYVYQSANVQKFIHSTDFQFDVVINEDFFGESFLMFAHKFKAPIITICEYSSENIEFIGIH